jgi:hypothetical protein
MTEKIILDELIRRHVPQKVARAVELIEGVASKRKATGFVERFVKNIIVPEIKPQASAAVTKSMGGARKKSGAQIVEKAERKASPGRVFKRDEKGRFAKHEFHNALSNLSQPKEDLLNTSNPVGKTLEPVKIKYDLLEPFESETPSQKALVPRGNKVIGSKREKDLLAGGEGPSQKALVPRSSRIVIGAKREKDLLSGGEGPKYRPIPPPKPKNLGRSLPQLPKTKPWKPLPPPPSIMVTHVTDKKIRSVRPMPPPKPKPFPPAIAESEPEEFKSSAGRPKKEISEKERKRREDLSERMKARKGTKREGTAEEKHIKRLSKK